MTAEAQLRADVAIIGAGIYGCSTAYFLSRAGVSTIVLDADDLGSGASGANAGNVHLQLSPFSHAAKSREWVSEFASMLPFFVEAVALWKQLALDLPSNIELRCPGGIMVAETERQMELLHEKVALERAHGLAVDMVTAHDLATMAKYLSRDLRGASHCAEEGMTNALGAVIALADGAKAHGTQFLLNARVIGLMSTGDSWRIDTIRGSVGCERVVIAAGSGSDKVAAMVGVNLPLSHRNIQMIATEPLEQFVDHLIYHCEHRLTLKQVANGNVLIGGGWAAGEDSVFHRPSVLRESLLGSMELAARIVPRLRSASMIRAWGGTVTYTPDGRPMLGEFPSHPGLYAAVCNTYGFTLGPLCGKLVADAIATSRPSVCQSDFSPGRFDVLAPTEN